MANQIDLGYIKGETGATGATGSQGVAGQNGLTPTISSSNNHWMVGTYDTGVTAKGNVWYTDSSNPTSQGVDDDLFLNTATYDIFKKVSGIWTLIGNVKGAKGDTGDKGDKGDKGDTALTVTLGTVTTGNAGTDASVTNSGTNTDLVLDFVIPRGDKGEAGETTVYMEGQAQGRVDLDAITNAEIDNLF